MKENAIKFLYAIDCYLLYMLSGVVAAAGVVVYYSLSAALDYNVADSAAFVNYISDFVSGKASVVLLVSYCLIFITLLLVFAVRRRSLGAYSGMSYARFLSVAASVVLGILLNLIVYAITPDDATNEEQINTILILCVILGPFVEELMFRGILLKMFGSACGIFAAVIITSALFALSHADTAQILYSFVLGIVLCIVRVKSTSLWSPVGTHLAFNITGAVALMYNPVFSKNEIIMFFVVGALFFVIACSGGRKLAKEK